MKQLLMIGTYTEDILFGTGQLFRGQGKGLSICSFENGMITEIETLPVRNPSFVCSHPDRKKLLRMLIAMGAELEDVQNILKRSSYPQLYVKNPADCVIIYGVCNHLNVTDINLLLYEYEQELL